MTNMPNEIQEIYKLLEEEVLWLHIKWNLYRQLFGTDENRINLLNEFAPVIFRVYQEILYDDVILSICRLTDEKSRYQNQNYLTLLTLVHSVNPRQYDHLHRNTQENWRKLSERCIPFRLHRHQRIAHTNLLIVESIDTLLPGISRKMIESVLEDIRNLMNAVSEYFDETTQTYKLTPPDGINGELFIQHLEKLHTFYETDKRTRK